MEQNHAIPFVMNGIAVGLRMTIHKRVLLVKEFRHGELLILSLEE